MDDVPEHATFQLRQVTELTGLPRNTLLAWERRYGLVIPDRLPNGYRMYSRSDVALLGRVRSLVDQGFRVGDAIRMQRGEAGAAPLPEPAMPPGEEASAVLRAELKRHLYTYDRSAAERVRQRLYMLSFGVCLRDVYMPLLREVGGDWEAGAACVAQEHFASAFIREHLITMMRSLAGGPSTGPSVLLAGFPHERHELGLLAVGIELALRGFRVVYLGVELPFSELGRVAIEHDPDIVALSTMVPAMSDLVASAAREVRAAVGDRLVVIGGAGVRASGETSGAWLCPSFDDFESRWRKEGRAPVSA